MSGLVYFNGMLKHEHEVSLWTLDRSYLYGEGLFETMKASQGFIPFLPEHLHRLFRGLDLLRMPIDLSASKLEFSLYQTLHHNRLKDAYLRLTLSRQNKETGTFEPGDAVNLLVVAKALDKAPKKIYTDGAGAKVIEDFRISPDPLCQVKSTNYLRNLLAQRMAKEGGFDEALLLNSAGNLVEAATANLFIFDGDKFVTPPLSEGALPGVTRRIILELLEKNYLGFEERPLKVSDLLTAPEAFLTSALKEVMPLTRVNDKPIGRGSPGKETERVAALFNEEKQYRIESFESKKWGVE
jgi:branched-subunit amino acid aminotransferase/4-amino-4-deoxychorismate lyase